MMVAFFAAFAAAVISVSFAYLWVMFFAGLRTMRRSGARLDSFVGIGYGNPFTDEPSTFHTYFLVPCLDEERVIGNTVKGLSGSAHSTTVVIDDASEDRTIEVAREYGGPELAILARQLPNARVGKGEALNDGLRLVRELVEERGQDIEQVLVAVMDADGRLSDGAMSHIVPVFEDPEVGAIQLAVRIRNRTSWLTRYQDFHFWSNTAVAQFGRVQTGTVSLGGNGQFSRLSALNAAGERPWSESLTEDLDLAVTLAVQGWKLSSTPHAAVEQQGVETIGALFTQRRRWFQGHMMMAKRLPEIWKTPALNHFGALELSAYILTPWVTILPWSILFHWALIGLAIDGAAFFAFVTNSVSLLVGVVFWYLLTLGPVFVSAWVYYKRDERKELWVSMMHAHAFPLINYLAFAAVWSALARILKGQRGWQKTDRSIETPLIDAKRTNDVEKDQATLPLRAATDIHSQKGEGTDDRTLTSK